MAIQRPRQFDTLLRVRQRQEDLAALSLASARREMRAARRQRDKITEEQRRTLNRTAALLRDRFDANEARGFYQYERYLAQLRDIKDASIHELHGVAENRRAELEEAARRKRVVEKLIARKMAAYELEMMRLERKAMDEIATNQAAQQRMSRQDPALGVGASGHECEKRDPI